MITEALALALGFTLGILTVMMFKHREPVTPGRHRRKRYHSPSARGYWESQ